MLRREKVLEIRFADLEAKLKEADSKLKQYKARQLADIDIQTDAEQKPMCFERTIQACVNVRDETIQAR